MNGNTPYAGRPGVIPAGERSTADQRDLSPEQRQLLREHVSKVVTQTREYLPDTYTVGGQLRRGMGGPEAAIAVQPPVGHPISAGFEPATGDRTGADSMGADDFNAREVAQGLAATAALQVKEAMDGENVLAAR